MCELNKYLKQDLKQSLSQIWDEYSQLNPTHYRSIGSSVVILMSDKQPLVTIKTDENNCIKYILNVDESDGDIYEA